MLLLDQARKRQTRPTTPTTTGRRRVVTDRMAGEGGGGESKLNFAELDDASAGADTRNDDKERGRHQPGIDWRRIGDGADDDDRPTHGIRLAMAGCFAIGSRRFVLLRWTPTIRSRTLVGVVVSSFDSILFDRRESRKIE